MEEVRVCRICGHINPTDDRSRCDNCRGTTGLITVPRSEGERWVRARRRDAQRVRLLRRALVTVPILGLALWILVSVLHLGPDPPAPSTSLNADTGPGTWAQGRRVPQNTGFTPEQAPVPEKVLWTYTTARALVSSPAVVDGRIYLTADDGRVVSLDGQTGRLLWEYRTGLPSSSTPAVAGDLVIFALRPGPVVALDRSNGDLRWERDLGDAILSSPVLAEGTIYIGAADNNLHSLDAATGEDRWTFNAGDWIISPAAYADNTVVVTSKSNVLNIVDTKTGRRRFIYDAGRSRRISVSGPIIQGNLAYFGSQDGAVWAIDRRAKTYPLGRAILYFKTSLFLWGVSAEPPVQKGSVWATDIGDGVAHPPAADQNQVYATTRKGKVVALDAATGDERWSTDLGVEITAAPTVAGNTVLVGTRDGRAIGLGTDRGSILWEFQTGGEISGSPVVAEGAMYVVSHDGVLYALTDAG